MGNPVRRLAPRSLDPRQNQGPPVLEAGLIEDLADDDTEDRSTVTVVMPDGSFVPRYKPFRVRTAPPAPSPSYRADPRYVLGNDFHNETLRRALHNNRLWADRHSNQFHPVTTWLTDHGCAPGVETARAALRQVTHANNEAAKRLSEAQARAAQAETALTDAVRQAIGGGRLPAGEAVLNARREVEAAQLVADTVAALEPGTRRKWQQALGQIDWKAALEAAEKLDGPEAADAAAWIRAQIHPPVSAAVDPLAWL